MCFALNENERQNIFFIRDHIRNLYPLAQTSAGQAGPKFKKCNVKSVYNNSSRIFLLYSLLIK